jgi:hypothetical protein
MRRFAGPGSSGADPRNFGEVGLEDIVLSAATVYALPAETYPTRRMMSNPTLRPNLAKPQVLQHALTNDTAMRRGPPASTRAWNAWHSLGAPGQ